MTFTTHAIKEQGDVIESINALLVRVVESKAKVSGPALDILVDVQASLIAIRTGAGEVRQHLQAAGRNNEHTHLTAPDRKRAAAGDTDAEPELQFFMPPNE